MRKCSFAKVPILYFFAAMNPPGMIVLRRNIQSEVDAPGDDADADADAGAAPKAEALKPTAPAPAPTKTAPAKSQAASKASKGDFSMVHELYGVIREPYKEQLLVL